MELNKYKWCASFTQHNGRSLLRHFHRGECLRCKARFTIYDFCCLNYVFMQALLHNMKFVDNSFKARSTVWLNICRIGYDSIKLKYISGSKHTIITSLAGCCLFVCFEKNIYIKLRKRSSKRSSHSETIATNFWHRSVLAFIFAPESLWDLPSPFFSVASSWTILLSYHDWESAPCTVVLDLCVCGLFANSLG